MTAAIIGILGGLISIVLLVLFKNWDKALVLGLALAGIAFLYIGYNWSDLPSFLVSCLQTVFFLFLAYLGVKRHLNFLAAGYFLHGLWDMVYPFVQTLLQAPELTPPNYDWFCMSFDVVLGIYIVF